jgi:hypothetical protein
MHHIHPVSELRNNLNQHEGYDADIEALWVREAETRYDEIAAGKVVSCSLDEAIDSARAKLSE